MPFITISESVGKSLEHVAETTQWFANHSSPSMGRVRECLDQKGIVVGENSVVVEFFEDDDCLVYGLLVTQEKLVFNFHYDYYRKNQDEGWLSHWEECNNAWQALALSGSVKAGLKYYEKKT